MARGLRALVFLIFFANAAQADGLRIVTYGAPFSRAGPGLLLRDLQAGDDPQLTAALDHLRALAADIIVLTSFDFDHDGLALQEVALALAQDALAVGSQVPQDVSTDKADGPPHDAKYPYLFSRMALLQNSVF